MSKRGNYFLALYDSQDNYVRDFESIQECADYFNTSPLCIRTYLCRLQKIKNEFLIYKIDSETDFINSEERTR